MRRLPAFTALFAGLLAAGAARAGEVGSVVDVAPKAPETRMQMWPRAAWCGGARSWLVVWREGYVNQEETDVWAGRVSAEGKALDPAGLRLTKAKDRQERARAASDGTGWLVVWQDFRNGKDYDVFAARVSGEGEVLDEDGFLVAGGAHNQCFPDVAFSGGQYVVVWQAFVGEPPDGTEKDGVRSGYRIFGTTVSSAGKVAAPGGASLVNRNDMRLLMRPAVAAVNGRVLVAFNAYALRGPRYNSIGTVWVDGASGKAGAVQWEVPKGRHDDALEGNPLALAWGRDGGLALSRSEGLNDFKAWRVEASGARVLPHAGMAKQQQKGFSPWCSVASDGERYLVTRDHIAAKKPMQVLGVQARFLPADWKGGDLNAGVFPVAGDGQKSCLQGEAAAGDKGTFLVTYAEARGVDDVKVVARLVKP